MDDIERTPMAIASDGPAPLSGLACVCIGVGFVLLLAVALAGVRYLGG